MIKPSWFKEYDQIAHTYNKAIKKGVEKEAALEQAERSLRKLGFFGNRLKDELDILGED